MIAAVDQSNVSHSNISAHQGSEASKEIVQLMDGLSVHLDSSLPQEIKAKLSVDNYEYAELRLAHRMIEPEDQILEIGCGIGVVAIACARICGDRNITCYEANPGTADLIRRNFALNGMNPRLRGAAVTTHNGAVDFYFNDNIVSSSLFDRQKSTPTTVDCVDICDVVEELNPNVIVMDAEGAEIELLQRADLSNVDKLLVEVHPSITGHMVIDELFEMLSIRGLELQDELTHKNVSFFVRKH